MKALLERKQLSWVFGLFSVIALIAAAAATTSLLYYNRVLPNSFVAGIDIGSQQPAQALNLLRQKAIELGQESVSIKLNDTEAVAKLSELGITLVPEQSNSLTTTSTDQLIWLKPRYWQSFFSKKHAPISYVLSKETFEAALESKLGFSNTATNAVIEVEGGKLVVKPAKSGVKINIDDAISQVNSGLSLGVIDPIVAKHTETTASVSTETAEAIKTQIVASLKPVVMRHQERTFTLSIADQYTVIDYKEVDSKLSWSISKDRLSTLLNNRIASKINVKMIQKVIVIETNEVTNEGREGIAVELSTLTNLVYQTITEQKTDVIEIPSRPIPITENIITPGYVANLFPGIYVDINLERQRMYIMEGPRKLQEFLISTGKRGTPTPTGLLYVKNKIEIAQSRLYPGIWMRKWNALSKNPDGSGYEGYGIHDLPCFDPECRIVEGASHLGFPVSHGCIRLGHDSAIWFYDNIPVATPVNIHF